MSSLGQGQSRIPAPSFDPSRIAPAWVFLFIILLIAVFTRFWRLDTPNGCYFDEVYFPTQAAEVLRGDSNAWLFIGHENTHPPLSKEIMALGMALPLIGGNGAQHDSDVNCWPDEEDNAKENNPDWMYDPVGWRFFGALASVGAVFFMYLLAKRLFQSEVAGLAAAAFLTFDGLALAQARIGTPDTFVLFFTLACLYFLTTNRFLLSGMMFGAAAATKWIGAFTLLPIVLYLVVRLVKGILETEPDQRMRDVELVLKVGAALMFIAAGVGAATLSVAIVGSIFDLIEIEFTDIAIFMALPAVPGLVAIGIALVVILLNGEFRSTPRGRLYLQTAFAFPLFFLVVPFIIYCATYIPMLMSGYSVGDVIDLNRSAYEFHSSLETPHSYASDWYEWPIMRRPIYFYVNQESPDAKIYSLGNPAVFWMAIPALLFVVWSALKARARFNPESGRVAINGAIAFASWPLMFVALSYLGVWLPWATQPRVLFIYHYLPALTFAILALGYSVSRLYHADREWGRFGAMGVVVLAGITFFYFYPHLSAIDVPRALEESYYWFGTWR